MEIWSGVTDASHTHSLTDNRIYRATQLVSSIKHNLSHAIWSGVTDVLLTERQQNIGLLSCSKV